jgi:hypothetical protein
MPDRTAASLRTAEIKDEKTAHGCCASFNRSAGLGEFSRTLSVLKT